MEYNRIKGEVLDYVSGWDYDFDIDAIMDDIREEAPNASTIDDIDPDTFQCIIRFNVI